MEIAGLILIPIMLLFNSFGIGKVISKYKKPISNGLSFCMGFFIYVIISSIFGIVFHFLSKNEIVNIYIILGFQIFLILIYAYHWKSFIFALKINKIRFLSFFGIFALTFIVYLIFILFDLSNIKLMINPNDFSNQNNLSLFQDVFLTTIMNFFKLNSLYYVQFFYRISFSVFMIFLITCSTISIMKINDHFYWKKYLLILLFSFIKSSVIFNSYISVESLSSILLLQLFLSLDFYCLKNYNSDFENKYFQFNSILVSMVFLNSSFVIYSCLLYLIFMIVTYCKKTYFGIDYIIKSFIYLLSVLCIFFLSFKIEISLIIFVVFLICFSIYHIVEKNSIKYYDKIFKIEVMLRNKIKYILLTGLILFIIIYLILVAQNKLNFDVNIFELVSNSNINIIFKKYVNIVFWIISIICFIFSIIYFIFDLRNKKVIKNRDLVSLSYITLFLYNPIFLNIQNNMKNFYYHFQVNFQIEYLFLIIFIYLIFLKKVLKIDYNNSRYFLIEENDLKNKNKLINIEYYVFYIFNILIVATIIISFFQI